MQGKDIYRPVPPGPAETLPVQDKLVLHTLKLSEDMVTERERQGIFSISHKPHES
jgi:hypothetical protein